MTLATFYSNHFFSIEGQSSLTGRFPEENFTNLQYWWWYHD